MSTRDKSYLQEGSFLPAGSMPSENRKDSAHDSDEKTEVWYGLENITRKQLEIISKTKASVDYCHSPSSPSILVTFEPYMQVIMQLSRKGVKQRYITEITIDNIKYCKELAKYLELRHFDGAKGNLGIIDRKIYGAIATTEEATAEHVSLPTEFIYSNSRAFVDQQQYFFDNLWNKAIPAEQKIKEIEEGITPETTEVIEGTENVVDKLIEGFSNIKTQFDNCIDHTCPSAYVSTKQVWDRCIELEKRGIKLRFITEVTKENIPYCVEIMKIAELRHLDGIRGNFGIADKTDYRATSTIHEGQPPTQAIRSTVRAFVDQQQYFFETLWNKAMPAKKKIKAIEEGRPLEVTEIWYGVDNIAKKSWEILSRAKVFSDFCHDSRSPSILVTNKQYLNMLTELKQRGVKHRFVTTITNENIIYCKKLANYVELRHLDDVKGNLAIIDRSDYGATANLSEFQPPAEFIYSNVKPFVDQQQEFFDMIWNKAIPAPHRIRELEEGIKPEFIETITDPHRVQKIGFELASSANNEILAIFSTANAFHRQERVGTIDLLKDMAERHNVKVRILTPEDESLKLFAAKLRSQAEDEQHKQDNHKNNFDVRFIEPSQQTKVSILIVDKMYSLAVEVKDDVKESSLEAMGLTTYSNSKATVSSYASIFETLWNQIELYEQLKVHEKLEREFINIAAHELRTPMQPIIGLSELLRSNVTSKKQRQMLDVIISSANRLQELTEELLDVARIESQTLKIRKERVDLNELIQNSIRDIANQIDNSDKKVRLVYDPAPGSIFIDADKGRLTQVITNLLDNALKFTTEGTVNIRTTEESSGINEGHRQALVSIKDTGIGIDPEIMRRLFTKFASKSERGTGLGLFISKSIIEAHGGKIWAENNKDGGRGAIFTFNIPIHN